MRHWLIVLTLAAVASLSASTSSQAADPYGGFYGHGFPWFGYGNQGPAAYALGNIPAPPYFALHPPVYYSHSIPRPYGHSPFACPCDCHHESVSVSRVVVPNPFVRRQAPEAEAEAEASDKAKVAAAPIVKVNPFYEPGKASALVSTEGL